MPNPDLATRTVRSADPSLSQHANDALTEALRDVIGADTVEVPADRPDHDGDRHATHSGLTSSAIAIRLVITIIGLTIAMTAAIAIVGSTRSAAIAALAAAFLIPTTYVVAMMTVRMTNETEHLDPDLSAELSAEGIGDPDRTCTDLVADFRPAD